ncbi:hypothetical protein BH20CHL1_BH20CHL1_03010 [soil metagenome]
MTVRYIVNVEAAIVHDERYLMIVRGAAEAHAPGTLSLPGGKVENAGVTASILEETLRREIREEAAVEIEDELVYIESKSFIADESDQVIDIVFLCRYRSGEPAPMDPEEVAALSWMTADDVLRHPKTPLWTHQSIELAERRRLELGW